MTSSEVVQGQVAAEKEPLSEAAVVTRILLSVFFFLALWAGAVVTWGLPGLYMPAVALVPVIFAGLMLITRG